MREKIIEAFCRACGMTPEQTEQVRTLIRMLDDLDNELIRQTGGKPKEREASRPEGKTRYTAEKAEKPEQEANPKDPLAVELRQLLDKTGWTVTELAKRAGISWTTASNVLQGKPCSKTVRGLLAELIAKTADSEPDAGTDGAATTSA